MSAPDGMRTSFDAALACEPKAGGANCCHRNSGHGPSGPLIAGFAIEGRKRFFANGVIAQLVGRQNSIELGRGKHGHDDEPISDKQLLG